MYEQIKAFINPKKNEDLAQAHQYQRQHLPTLWLLGKTGAGKSSLVQALTSRSEVEVGNGFQPCTKTASVYDFPNDKPIFRFLDTRGLAEVDYDPSDDIKHFLNQAQDRQGKWESHQAAHALVVVIKLEEVEQSALINALKVIKNTKQIEQITVVLTAVKQVENGERSRLAAFHQTILKDVWGAQVETVEVDFELNDGTVYNLEGLVDVLSKQLPIVGMMLEDKEHASVEVANFDRLENEVLWYAGSASASDLIPAVGLVSVPAIQAKMLHALAQQYGVVWNKRAFAELSATLGSSFGIQYGLKLGARQLTKMIPVYGQTVGSVTAAAMSFATTYGLGRAACYYFYHKSRDETVSTEAMQTVYKEALMKGKKVGSNVSEGDNE
ncbi:GTP-binding DUF697 domain-containing protein [Vibrio sp. ZSDE26]|uniref:GTP-binding DUF697 domain-containing protein n=1 Tax=Vibrio amylolyticus TaxID=2847292 RepID=A0A9X1XI70_9VIBR|nr:GTPase [Vibrio amylolyticus]MCK6263667.1 GTP-binding DUF697 domain-containing protein [Vibrio amylolyticus]